MTIAFRSISSFRRLQPALWVKSPAPTQHHRRRATRNSLPRPRNPRSTIPFGGDTTQQREGERKGGCHTSIGSAPLPLPPIPHLSFSIPSAPYEITCCDSGKSLYIMNLGRDSWKDFLRLYRFANLFHYL